MMKALRRQENFNLTAHLWRRLLVPLTEPHYPEGCSVIGSMCVAAFTRTHACFNLRLALSVYQ